MTLLIASVLEADAAKMVQTAKAALARGADAVELRLDGLESDPSILSTLSLPRATKIFTLRTQAQGGRIQAAAADRLLAFLMHMITSENVILDWEFDRWEGLRGTFKKLGVGQLGGLLPMVILSAHFNHLPENIGRLATRMLDNRRAVAKIAYAGGTAADGFAAADLMHEHGPRVIAICMGEAGQWTRILAKKLGAFGTFASESPDSLTAPGQLALDAMRHEFRWRKMNHQTAVYGLIGDPVAHSLSPRLHNRWFTESAIDAVYVPFLVKKEENAVQRFLDGIAERPWLDCRGFSVTVPHKEAVLAYLGGSANSMSRSIGAVNTICIQDGKPVGYNTDCYAAVDSLATALCKTRIDLAGLTVDVLGAGGAAKAVVAGLVEMGCRVIVYARNQAKGKELATRSQCSYRPWEERIHRQGEVLINSTPVGMWTSANDAPPESPLPREALVSCRLVFDLIYRPGRTRLLADAQAAGCQTLNGLDMFVRQAAMQFELWTGRSPDRSAARQWLETELKADS